MNNIDREIDLTEYIDRAVLNPTATPEDVRQGCEEAIRHNFPAVCVYPSAVRQAVDLLHHKKTKVCTVIGFPSGANTSASKLYEALEAVDNGAIELDVVINLGWLKSGNSEALYREIAQICEETGRAIKAILETSLLTEAEKRLAAEICLDAGVAFLKTSTGWFGGATVADISLLKEITKGRIGIKASGGIRTYDRALALVNAGATRLGTSHALELLRQEE
jgi:deoxyribose-phosphate aldolase